VPPCRLRRFEATGPVECQRGDLEILAGHPDFYWVPLLDSLARGIDVESQGVHLALELRLQQFVDGAMPGDA
jgi:hypothetical protein